MLKKERKERYAVLAFNIHKLETIQVVVEAATQLKSPLELAATPGTMDYAGRSYIQIIAETAAKENDIPIALHLDHHENVESIEQSLLLGDKYVMIDSSEQSFTEIIALTQKV